MCTRQEVQEIVDKAFKEFTIDWSKTRNEYWRGVLDEIKTDNEEQHEKLKWQMITSGGHPKTAPETRDRLEKLEICNTSMQDKVDHLVVLIKEQGKMTTEMYRVFTSAGWTKKVIIGSFAAVGIITGSVIGVIELIKRLKN